METTLLLLGMSRVTLVIENYKTHLYHRFLPSEELIVTILAIFKAGIAYVPIAPNWPEGRVRHVIEDASPIMIITNQDHADVLYEAQKDLPILKKREVIHFEELEDDSTNLSSKNIPINQAMNNHKNGGDKLYTILYTSGSTGLPKVVVKNQIFPFLRVFCILLYI